MVTEGKSIKEGFLEGDGIAREKDSLAEKDEQSDCKESLADSFHLILEGRGDLCLRLRLNNAVMTG